MTNLCWKDNIAWNMDLVGPWILARIVIIYSVEKTMSAHCFKCTESERWIFQVQRLWASEIWMGRKTLHYRSGENYSFRDETKTYLPAKNGQNSRNEIVKPEEAATVRRKAATWAATQVVGEKRNENGFDRKNWHENENILTLISINETNNFPHYGIFPKEIIP